MLKKTVTYTDPFEGNEVTEDLYFNLTVAEVTEMAMIEGEGWADHLQKLSTATQGQEIVDEFKKLLGKAYGLRDGSKHVKSPEITRDFLSSEAYSTLFMELITQQDSGAEFFRAILPKDLDQVAKKLQENQKPTADGTPAWVKENREPTPKELQGMTKAEMAELFRRRQSS